MIVDSHVRRLCPERLKVSLDVVDNGGPTHLIKIDVENGNGGAIRIVGRLIPDGPLDGNLFAVAGADHIAGQHDDVPLAFADGVHLQGAGDAKGRRLAGAERTAAGSAWPALQVLAVHLKKMVEARDRHTAAVVSNTDALAAGENGHLNPRRDTRIDVLQAVDDILPNNHGLILKR